MEKGAEAEGECNERTGIEASREDICECLVETEKLIEGRRRNGRLSLLSGELTRVALIRSDRFHYTSSPMAA